MSPPGSCCPHRGCSTADVGGSHACRSHGGKGLWRVHFWPSDFPKATRSGASPPQLTPVSGTLHVCDHFQMICTCWQLPGERFFSSFLCWCFASFTCISAASPRKETSEGIYASNINGKRARAAAETPLAVGWSPKASATVWG